MGTFTYILTAAPPNVPATAIPIDSLVNTALNIEYDEYDHKYIKWLDMMRLDDIIGDFADQFNYSFW